MEFPEIGEHCSEPTCNKLDFLPIKCDACNKIYCCEHMNYERHNCTSAYKKDVQVPVCPICCKPVPTPRNQKPDIAVSEHIDNMCKGDPTTKVKKKIDSNKCNVLGCKIKERIPVICTQCKKNFCLLHRFPDVHFCHSQKTNAMKTTFKKNQNSAASCIRAIHGLLSEDEALAKALSESMKEDFYQENGKKQEFNLMSSSRCLVS